MIPYKIGASINKTANELKHFSFLAAVTPKTAAGAIGVDYGLPGFAILMLIVVCCIRK